MPCEKCGNPNCDSVFHKGDKVKVRWGEEWVTGTIGIDMRTSVVVNFDQPILYLKEIVTQTVTRAWWGGRRVSKSRTSEERILKSMTLGAAYVQFRD